MGISAPVDRRELQAGAAWAATLVVLVVALRPFREDLEPGTSALVLLLAPLVAALGSLRLTAVAAVVSAIVFNYVFTEPYESLEIASDTSVAAFAIYLGIACTFGVVTAQLRGAGAACALALAALSLWIPSRHRGHAHDHAVSMALAGDDYCVQ